MCVTRLSYCAKHTQNGDVYQFLNFYVKFKTYYIIIIIIFLRSGLCNRSYLIS